MKYNVENLFVVKKYIYRGKHIQKKKVEVQQNKKEALFHFSLFEKEKEKNSIDQEEGKGSSNQSSSNASTTAAGEVLFNHHSAFCG